jgi:ABC-type dipeptide/oligopeptide/nickel transport system ATPase component
MRKKVDWSAIVEQAAQKSSSVMHNMAEDIIKSMQEAGMGQGVTPEEIQDIVKPMLDEFKKEVLSVTPKVIEVKLPKKAPKKVERTHYNFEKLVRMSSAKLNVALIGESGSGKSFGSVQLAEALGLEHYTMSLHGKMTATDLRGYCDANGKYNDSPIYKAFKNGGLLVLDEFDRSNTEVTVSLNNLLAGSSYLFPNGEQVKKHEEFRVIACQNTTGTGGSKTYAAAQRQDGATLNRFVKLEWNIDEALEIAVAGNTIATRAVQKMRHNAREMAMTDIIISPRQSIDSNKLMEVGFTLEEALEHTILHGLADDVRKRLMNGVSLV